MSDFEDTAFYRSIFRVGGFYFTFKDDTRELLDMQPYSKIGRGRTVNVVRMDESGTSYKQYSKKGVFDSDRDSVIDDINFRLSKRSKQRTKFVFAIIFFVLSGFFIVASIITSFMFGIADAVEMMFGEGGGVFFAVVLLIGILLFLSATKIRKPYLLYDITPEREKELKAFYNEISKIDESEKIWLVNTTDRHNDPKRNAGATSNVSRSEENYHHLSFIDGIETNVFIPSIGRRLYFFPDVLLISKREEIKPVFYDKMEIILSTTQFSEQGEIPSDSEEISSSWLYVNLDGSPDRRRKENRKIPIVKYGDIRIKSNDGSLSRIMTSNYEIGQTVANTLHNYKPKT
jgi:hypothetical protein